MLFAIKVHFFASTIKHSSVRICMWKPIASKTKRSFFRRMRGRNVSSTHPAGETTIVDTLLFLVACANYSAIGRKTEKRESALTSQSGFCGIPPRYPLEIKVKDNRERKIFDFLSKVSNPPPADNQTKNSRLFKILFLSLRRDTAVYTTTVTWPTRSMYVRPVLDREESVA